MFAPKHAGIGQKCYDSVLDDLIVIGRGTLLISDVEVVTAREPNP